MTQNGIWDKAKEDALLRECTAAVEAAAEEYLATPPQPPETIFEQTYAQLPVDLAEQRDSAFQSQVAP